MFTDWPSDQMHQKHWIDQSPISAFKDTLPWKVGRDFVQGTAKHLYDGLGIAQAKPTTKSTIIHDKQLQIIMPAIGYGLSFPLSEHEILRNCVYVYNDWLSALIEPKPNVPHPILKDPNHYAQIIIRHFYYLFVPRESEAIDEINRQALLCHRVLRTLQDTAKYSTIMNEETWQTLLFFLLHINSALLSPPAVKNDAGEQLGDRVLGVLFETWLRACAKSFPPPPLWNSLRENCQKWRHRPGLIDQWNRISRTLTVKLLLFMYGPSFISKELGDDELIPREMTRDCIAQAWFRILHIIGNPVDLSKPDVISKTPAFLKYAITSDLVIEPYQHPCLSRLPIIFLTAMKGVSELVNFFLSGSDSIKQHVKGKPRCNSILHLFGPWLFEAAFISASFVSSSKSEHGSASSSFGSTSHRPSSALLGEGHKKSNSSIDTDSSLDSSLFQMGRAEALGALCRIFCSKKTGEEILPVYLARFYLAVREGLHLGDNFSIIMSENVRKSSIFEEVSYSETASSILLNGTNLFSLDLDGINTLLPGIINVLNLIMLNGPENLTATKKASETVIKNLHPLRRACIQILLSLLPLPLHFQGLTLKEMNSVSNDPITISQFRVHFVNLISGSLQVESDASNIHMLLGGLVFCVLDATVLESSCKPELQSPGKGSSYAHSVSPEGMPTSELSSVADEVSESPQSSSLIPPPLSKPLSDEDSAHGLYVRAIYLVSHCLMSLWTKDVNVSLAGIELMCSLAVLNFDEQESTECKCAVKWLCDYIVYQCSRPPQAHSKDLHSMIVAAFHCTSLWLISHPHLLQDEDCLRMVLEVIELGISGSKSQSNTSEPPKYKHEKELKPVSMRVRDAAEGLLSCVLSQVGSFQTTCGSESDSSLLDEFCLLKHCNSLGGGEPLTKEASVQHFRYFVVQNNILIALLEQPLGNHEDPLPTVTVLIRGPFGRNAWTMQLRHLPRHKSSTKVYTTNPGRPLPITEVSARRPHKYKYFPDSIERIPLCKADKSIPSMEQVIHADQSDIDPEKLLRTLKHQVQFEESVRLKMEEQKRAYPDTDIECSVPQTVQEFQTARLFLSHFGLLDSFKVQERSSSAPQLIALNTSNQSFMKDLDNLDLCVNRTIDTVHIFYVKDGQISVEDILSNPRDGDSHPHFLEFLQSLGWPVNVESHPGWAGHSPDITMAFRKDSSRSEANERSLPYNGRDQVLYWGDAFCEIAFVVPNSAIQPDYILPSLDHQSSSSDAISQTDGDRSEYVQSLEVEAEGSSLSSHTSQISVSTETRKQRYGRNVSSNCCSNHRIFVAWLESQDDFVTFPKTELASLVVTGLEGPNWREKEIPTYIIYIHALANGLFKIKLEGTRNKLSLAGPLVDNQVVSRRVLGSLVRQTALNLSRRRRLESDSYQPPHVRRKFKIQEMVQKYQSEMNEPDFYTKLFINPID